MGLRERLATVTQFLQRAASRGHQLREEDEGGEQGASSAAKQRSQRKRDQQSRSSEPALARNKSTIAADEPTRSGKS